MHFLHLSRLLSWFSRAKLSQKLKNSFLVGCIVYWYHLALSSRLAYYIKEKKATSGVLYSTNLNKVQPFFLYFGNLFTCCSTKISLQSPRSELSGLKQPIVLLWWSENDSNRGTEELYQHLLSSQVLCDLSILRWTDVSHSTPMSVIVKLRAYYYSSSLEDWLVRCVTAFNCQIYLSVHREQRAEKEPCCHFWSRSH